ncbi:MAG: glycosyltransferase family 39 protein [Lachnospiraceae bacterium]|nr:glycosyltransferase family 39 protein [Lachnospiraceae bacterium]
MQKEKSRKSLLTGMLFVVLSVLSVIGIWKTIYFSADIDESYALTMAVRIASGDRMLLEMWEPHQMSAVLYAPLVACYKGITGSMEGALVFMRICGLVVQTRVSLFLYRTIRSHMPAWLAMTLSFAYFNFTPKHIQSPEFSILFYWAFMSLMLCLLRFAKKRKTGWMIGAGISMSVIVLCYPSAVMLFVYAVLWMLFRKDDFGKKAAAIFAGICAACGVLFVGYLLISGGGIGIFENISAILMDASHDQDMAAHLLVHLKGIWEMLYLVLALIVLCHVGRPVFCKKKKTDALFLGVLLLVTAVYAIYQFHTISDVNFMIFYPVILQLFVVEWYAYASFPKDKTDTLFFEVCFPLTVVSVFAIMVSSNVLTSYSMSYFMPGVILGTWQIYRVYARDMEEPKETQKKESGAGKRRSYAWMAILLLVCIMSQLLVARIFLVRFTSTRKKNIFEPYYEVTHDVLKGIRLGDFDYIQYEAKTGLVDKYVKDGDMLLYVGADMYLYSQLEQSGIATGNTISTPAFGEQLVYYYEKNPERIPTVVFVDREYGADFSQVLTTEPMKSFMETYFDVDAAVMEPAVTVYTRER